MPAQHIPLGRAHLAARRRQQAPPDCDHFECGDPAVFITFDLNNRDDGDEFESRDGDRCVVYRHYRVVVAFTVEVGIYAFESFSYKTWKWTIGAETVVPMSGVSALSCAFWRTTMDLEGRTTCTISLRSGTGYYADFIPTSPHWLPSLPPGYTSFLVHHNFFLD